MNYIKELSADIAKALEDEARTLLASFKKVDETQSDSKVQWQPDRIPEFQITGDQIVGPVITETPDPCTFQIICLEITQLLHKFRPFSGYAACSSAVRICNNSSCVA